MTTMTTLGAAKMLPAEERSGAYRHKLGLGTEAIADVFELVERLGIQPLRLPMGDEGPDGFYIHKGEIYIIAINSRKQLSRQRFTSCHELAHHVFEHPPHIDKDILASSIPQEREANAFAAYFLMPRDGVTRWLGAPRPRRAVTAEDAVRLSRHYGMSYKASIFHLRDLGYLRPQEAATLFDTSPEAIARRLGYPPADKGNDAIVLPADYTRRALLAFRDGKVSEQRLAELLGVAVDAAILHAEEAEMLPPDETIDDLLADAYRSVR